MSFPKLPSSPNFFQLEEEILQYWKDNQIFEKSIETRSEENAYRFYDGPPFITGLPHYGSLLSSVVKDIVTRFWTQKGKRIERVRGWDCHGIYVEQKIQDKLGYKSNKEIEAHGIKEFIEACYDYTKNVSDQWERYVDHIGRWVDFKNAYKTMDNDYMESVMRVFKSLRDKGMIYEGKRVSLYSTKLNTPISNYEVALDNSYADIADPAITVKFPLIGKDIALADGNQYEATQDGFICYAQAIIKDSKGGILSVYNQKHGNWQFPGGKVDLGETATQALERELQEELGVSVKVGKRVCAHKDIRNSHKAYLEFYEAEIINGEIQLLESDKHTAYGYTYIGTSENELGRNFTINNAIIDSEEEIRTFKDLYHYKQIVEHGALQGNGDKYPFSFLARTTTPRTIPANMALVVNKDIVYLQLFDLVLQEYFILAENLISKFYKDPSQYVIIYTSKGAELQGLSYQAPFDYYVGQSTNDHKVYLADYVTDSDGTGIVHTSPEFGEDDFQTGKRHDLTQSAALDEQGNYTEEIADMKGVYYRDANDLVMDKLKEKGLLFKKESITHSVAMCPRTGVPLIYKTQDNWFIDIKSIKERLFAENEKVNRVPEHLKHGRFLKSMESAPDRCISRTRYWATPMPVWVAESGKIIVCGSREDIFALDQTGSKILEKRVLNGKEKYRNTLENKEFDLHRPYIDAIWGIREGEKFTRITQVLDPWLESGSMPYAQVHYPFENKEKFEQSFPADYVAEYLGQVRCRFFFMHALGVMLFDNPAFTNVVCTGVLAGNDGRKMSKSYGNYPDPEESMKTHGSDSLRMYFASSPILVGGDMNFYEEGRKEIIRKVNLPLWNSFSFFTTYANIDKFAPTKHSISDFVGYEFKNDLDKRIIGKTAELITEVNKQMEAYNIQKATAPLFSFMDDLTNWYIRRNRRRFWKSENDSDKMSGYDVLYVVLIELCKVLAPFMPFLSEYIYRNLTNKESVHLDYRTDSSKINTLVDTTLLQDMDLTKTIVELGLSLRGSLKIKVKQPLQSLRINKQINPKYETTILEELNVKELIVDAKLDNQINRICIPNAKLLGKKLGSRFAEINTLAKSGEFELLSDNTVKVSDIILQPDEYEMRYEKGDLTGDIITSGNLVLMLDTTITPELKLEGYVRELIRSIQEARKNTGYDVSDRISLTISGFEAESILSQYGDYIARETLGTIAGSIENPDYTGECDVEEGIINFSIKK